MKALNGHTYAVIVNGRVRQLFTADDLPEWADSSEDHTHPFTLTTVDVTGLDPMPAVDWVYADGAFSAYTPTKEEQNALLTSRLAAIDAKKVRALSDALLTGDKTRLTALEADAATLRAKWKP